MLQGEKSPRHHFVLISISFLGVVAENSSLFCSTSHILTNRIKIQTFRVCNMYEKKLQLLQLHSGHGAHADPPIRTRTTPPSSQPHKIQKVCPRSRASSSSKQTAAASKQQLAHFSQCSDLQASGSRWQVMCRVDQASRKLGRFRTEQLLQQRFLVDSRKGREIETQTLCIRSETEQISKKSLNGKLTRPNEEKMAIIV